MNRTRMSVEDYVQHILANREEMTLTHSINKMRRTVECFNEDEPA